jgi:hypothetical protein
MSRTTALLGLLVLASALLAACSSAPQRTAVEAQRVAPNASAGERAVVAPNERLNPPIPDSANGLPAYPADLLPLRLPPRAVCLRLTIDEHGAVTDAQVGVWAEHCPPPDSIEAPFADSAIGAASKWRFEPAFRCVFPTSETAPSSGCIGDGVREVPLAVRQVYRLVFEQFDGQGRVRQGD